MEKQIEEKNTEMGNVITRSEEFIQKNQKTLIIVGIAIVVLAVAIFAYFKWYKAPREVRAANEMFAAEQWFAQDSLQIAMKGNAMHMGFEAIADEYGSTKAGNRAKYCAGIICLRQGEYQKAIDYLDQRLVKPIIEAINAMQENVCVAVLPDHPTPVELRIHVNEPVPFIIWHKGIQPDDVELYDEESCVSGSYGLLRLQEFMNAFMAVE